MFELILTEPTSNAMRAVHEASLRLSQRARLEYIRETAAFPVTTNELAARLLADIQQAEGKELADLTEAETDGYIREMNRLIQGRLKPEVPVSEEHGQALLAEMRAAYEERFPARR